MSDVADADRGHAADLAIARVLDAEQQALRSIEQARAETDAIAEQARRSAQSITERAERRILRVTQGFERAVAARLAELDAEGAALAQVPPLTAAERAVLQAAVVALARQIAGPAP